MLYLHPPSNAKSTIWQTDQFWHGTGNDNWNVITGEACSFVVFPEKIQTAQHILFANNVHTDVTEYYSKRAQKL